MSRASLECLYRRTYDPAELLAAHPPRLHHGHKRLVFERACPTGAEHSGPITVTRWATATLPKALDLAPTEVIPMPGVYDYAGPSEGVWHMNFADPHLFVAYGSALLAQDELQAAEHPLLGSIREALIAERLAALTEERDRPTPVLVAGVERRCMIDTSPNLEAGRPLGLYGNRFAAARPTTIFRALSVLTPPTRSNIIAMAAPGGGDGAYDRADVERVLVTAYTGFRAAVEESRATWPGVAVEVRTGFWGCGAFGGNRHVMTLLQILAARLAGVDRLRFFAFDDRGLEDFGAGAEDLRDVLRGREKGSTSAVVDAITERGYWWGESDGN